MLPRPVLPLFAIVLPACAPASPPPARSVDVAAVEPQREVVAPAVPAPQGARLEICRVDDDFNPFEPLASSRARLPIGVALELENTGPDYQPRFFARSAPLPGERDESARRRLSAWLDTVPLPPGLRFGLQREARGSFEGDPDPQIAWRSFVLQTPCELDDSAVESASLSRPRDSFGWRLSIELNRASADAFASLTESMMHRRLALVLDGTVMVAPRVMARIGGGRLEISISQDGIDLPLQLASGVPIKRD